MADQHALKVRATALDIEDASRAIFEVRKASTTASDAADRHPMLYREYTWSNLPPSEKAYYSDMAISALVSFGINCVDAPTFPAVAGA